MEIIAYHIEAEAMYGRYLGIVQQSLLPPQVGAAWLAVHRLLYGRAYALPHLGGGGIGEGHD